MARDNKELAQLLARYEAIFKLPQLCHPQGSKAITLDLGLDPTQLMLGPIVTFTSKKMKLSML